MCTSAFAARPWAIAGADIADASKPPAPPAAASDLKSILRRVILRLATFSSYSMSCASAPPGRPAAVGLPPHSGRPAHCPGYDKPAAADRILIVRHGGEALIEPFLFERFVGPDPVAEPQRVVVAISLAVLEPGLRRLSQHAAVRRRHSQHNLRHKPSSVGLLLEHPRISAWEGGA